MSADKEDKKDPKAELELEIERCENCSRHGRCRDETLREEPKQE